MLVFIIRISFKFVHQCWFIVFNSLAYGKFEWNFRDVIFQQILVIDGWGIACEIALIWMSLAFIDDQSTLVQVMAWCHQAIASRVTEKSLFMVMNVLFYFLPTILCPECTIPLKTTINCWFCHCRLGRFFLIKYCGITTVDLWRHASVGYRHYDVIFINCSCTCKLAQKAFFTSE